ncbi:MAG: excinuclease ABC subunit UvrC [Oscillospiraceae bacterium]|nr:excinuclease ABC subunit UvrC [Oscillospiraceae bacterium]
MYVGKAKNLKSRVSSYFVNCKSRDRKTAKLVEQIHDFDYIVTPKEIDAFVLETSLIKQHSPKYNILLKDSRGFNYVKITNEAYPRLIYTMNTDDKSAQYIGPYVGGYFVKQSVEDANRIFTLPSCTRKPDKFGKFTPHNPCLNYRIKRCMGVCLGNITQSDYADTLKSAVNYIKNGSKSSIDSLTEQMNTAAEMLEFEKAAKLRDRISAMQRAATVQSVISSKQHDYDVVGLTFNSHSPSAVNFEELAAVAIVKYSGGRLIDKQCFYLGDAYDAPQMLADFLREYYSNTDIPPPREVYTELVAENSELLANFLKIKFIVPKRGEMLSQITLARSNAEEFLALRIGSKPKKVVALETLANLLGLQQLPRNIECFDISNIGTEIKVGVMVSYRDAKPFRSGYRKFIIKNVVGTDDYACMKEVLFRRYAQADAFPDLVFVDGGSGHFNAAKSIFDELNITLGERVNLFGLTKDSKHKTRAIASGGGEIQVNSNKEAFALLTQIQDEAHRFAVTFARERHAKLAFDLTLRQVPGIGVAKATALLKRFKTKSALKCASVAELAEVAKISNEKAVKLFEFIEKM